MKGNLQRYMKCMVLCEYGRVFHAGSVNVNVSRWPHEASGIMSVLLVIVYLAQRLTINIEGLRRCM